MPSQPQLQTLQETLSSNAKVYSDPQSPQFQEHLKRWSNINLKTPGAIILPQTEEDCQKTIQWAISINAPFVAKAGGMSLYSTVSDDGIIVDLSDFASVKHDVDRREATLIGGISTKVVAMELAKDGYCTTLANANTVGALPFFLGGGNSILSAKLGRGTDNIVSARMITAKGELITVSETENADLLYAIRGAGQYFGVVLSLTVRTYPVLEVFGNDEGKFWSGRFVFPTARVDEVSKVLERLVQNDEYFAGGVTMVAARPPAHKPVLMASVKLIGPDCESKEKEVFKALYDLQPMVSGGDMVRIENNADAFQFLTAPGDYKKLRFTGTHDYHTSILPELVTLWEEMTISHPSSAASVFGLLWDARGPLLPSFESANSHDVRFMTMVLTWNTDAESQDSVQDYMERAVAVTRKGQKDGEYVDFANSAREPESPLARRYKGAERLDRLRTSKRVWDPEGVFGGELLKGVPS